MRVWGGGGGFLTSDDGHDLPIENISENASTSYIALYSKPKLMTLPKWWFQPLVVHGGKYT